ncbi:hypothetical protein J8F10_16530 [Gemmata sp. G18]|uniref:RNA polymerase sigma-70 region 2 domain-containing protein n=1 Tax=Gemmata palustris TaxID=2822762 RepID=A0ABS5BT32_9BACT|nr:hypothetical protein [Gemmata palustris]MBP3956879.1 hypothetical protein [Gemmata palustris]
MLVPVPAAPPALVAPFDRQHVFVALLPALTRRAEDAFRAIRSAHDREDAVAEVVARAWEGFLALPHPHGADPGALADTAVRAVRAQLLAPAL